MNDERTPAQVRTVLGMSREKVAELAGVGRDTVRIFEANPAAVSEDTRVACGHVYRELARALQRIRAPRAK